MGFISFKENRTCSFASVFSFFSLFGIIFVGLLFVWEPLYLMDMRTSVASGVGKSQVVAGYLKELGFQCASHGGLSTSAAPVVLDFTQKRLAEESEEGDHIFFRYVWLNCYCLAPW